MPRCRWAALSSSAPQSEWLAGWVWPLACVVGLAWARGTDEFDPFKETFFCTHIEKVPEEVCPVCPFHLSPCQRRFGI